MLPLLSLLMGPRLAPSSLHVQVRQGCPLSPLLFIIVIDALTEILNQDVASTMIERVSFSEINLPQVHVNKYADILALLIKADMSIVNHCQYLLDSFGHASGLFCY